MTATPRSDLLVTRPLGRSALSVTSLCVGTNALGSIARLYGYDVDAERAVETIRAVLASPINFVDTSNGYAGGESEKRIGAALRAVGGPREGLVIATKVDPDPASGDFSGDRVRRSVEESLRRLGVDHLRLLYLHDPERIDFDYAIGPGGPVEALVRLRDEGTVDEIGVAGGPITLLRRYLDLGEFGVLLTHSRHTLLDRSASELIGQAFAQGVGVVNAAPYGGGMLAKGPSRQPRYAYGQAVAHDSVLAARVVAMDDACRASGVPLAAAALQFSVRDPRIASTVVGVSRPERIGETIGLLDVPIPQELWDRLEELTPPPDMWLN